MGGQREKNAAARGLTDGRFSLYLSDSNVDGGNFLRFIRQRRVDEARLEETGAIMTEEITTTILFDAGPLDQAALTQLKSLVFSDAKQRKQFRESVGALEEKLAKAKTEDKDANRKLGLCLWVLNRCEEAVERLAGATDDKERRYYQALCERQLGLHSKAIANFERAEAHGWDAFQIAMQIVETLRTSGETAEAAKMLKRCARTGEQHADYHYQLGCFQEIGGEYEEAMDSFEKAIELESDHVPACFKLAYALDLRGDEIAAIPLYKKCISTPPVHVNALINLSVICEDIGRLDDAERYLERVLAANPNHARARLFLKDVNSCRFMVIDEDRDRDRDIHNAVLEIPITDFELSVRSRNCLKKMNIRTLGDLLRITEAELLAYKNFGETSLEEIKIMLTQKGLRLGQALLEQDDAKRDRVRRMVPDVDEELLNKPVGELELTLRSRKCLQRLGISTMGELAAHTEAELLGVKNFGQTSLVEIREGLVAFGLGLRKLED